MFSLKKEILFNGLVVLCLMQIFSMKAQGHIDFTVALILTSAIFLILYFRILVEIKILREELLWSSFIFSYPYSND